MNSANRMPSAVAANEHQAIEPGLLGLFRLFVVSMIGLLAVRVWLIAAFNVEFRFLPSAWTGIVLLTLLLGYLLSSHLERWIGRFYLPVGIGVFVVLALLGTAAGVKLRLAAGLPAAALVRGTWVLAVMLVVPLVLVAWQYGFRWALLYCLTTGVVDIVLTAPLAYRGGLPLSSLLAIALVRTLVLLPVGYTVARIMDVQRRQRAELAEAHARLARYATTLENIASERERTRLALELHDTLAHGLSSIAVQLEAMMALWATKPDTVRAMLSDALTTTRTALSESRRAIKSLRAHPLEDMGLARALRHMVESAATHAGIELELQLPATIEGLDSDTEHAIYRIASEATANVVRHANARCLTFTINDDEHGLQLTIVDDGRGFDSLRSTDDDHFGLYGMRERARMIGAELNVASSPGQGTVLRLGVRRKN